LSNAPKTYFYDGSLLTLHRLFGAHVRNRFAFVGRLESDVLDALPTTVSAGSADLPYGVGRLLMGLVFSIGLILVVIGGAELQQYHRHGLGEREGINWVLAFIGNFAGNPNGNILLLARTV
jgi:hypothetical protein